MEFMFYTVVQLLALVHKSLKCVALEGENILLDSMYDEIQSEMRKDTTAAFSYQYARSFSFTAL